MTELARLSCSQEERALVARLEGELDMTNVGTLEDELLSSLLPDGLGVVLDLSPTTYIDSAGIRMLFNVGAALRARGRELRLVVPEDAVIRRALLLVQVGEAAPMHEAVQEAVAALRAPVG
jgi:anti-anti-sigma factor